MFRPGFRDTNEAKMISTNSRIKKSIMFGATKSNNGPDPKYAPTAAVTIDKASKLYTFLMKTSLSVVEAEAAAVTPRVSVAVDPNLIIFSLYLDEINLDKKYWGYYQYPFRPLILQEILKKVNKNFFNLHHFICY